MSAHPLRLHVTGGKGRLASLLADHFRAPSHEVSLFSHRPSPGFTPLETLLHPGTLAAADVILHLAWSSLPATSEQQPGIEEVHDLPFLTRLLDALAGCPAASRPLFVFFSSGGAVYGNAPGRPNREDDVCRPIGHYGRAKLAAEALISRRVAAGQVSAAILRISNPYGYPVPKSRAQGLIPHALRCAVENQPLTVWGDGTARKDFIYYTDFLSALDQVLERRLAGTYNVCAGESHSVSEVIGLVEAETGKAIARRHIAAPDWDIHDSRLDLARFSAATGWKPQVNLREGIRRAAAGYADQ